MADNFVYDDIFTKETVQSMKKQMVPSDDVINALLADISSMPYEPVKPAVKETQIHTVKKKHRLTGYIAACACATLLLAGSLSMVGGDDPDAINAAIGEITGNDDIVIIENENIPDDNPVIETEKESEQTTAEPISEDSQEDEETNSEVKTQQKSKAEKTTVNKVENKKETKVEEAAVSEWVKEVLSCEAAPDISYDGSDYQVADANVSVTDTEVATVSLKVEDSTSTDVAELKGKAVKIKDVSPNMMVAVEVEGTDDTLIYANKEYEPDNLGEFINDTGITQDTGFSNVILTDERIGYSSSQNISASEAKICMNEFVLNQKNAESVGTNVYMRDNTYVSLRSSGKQNPTGTEINFEVNLNGYLYVKLATGNAFSFYIGEEQAADFIASLSEAQ